MIALPGDRHPRPPFPLSALRVAVPGLRNLKEHAPEPEAREKEGSMRKEGMPPAISLVTADGYDTRSALDERGAAVFTVDSTRWKGGMLSPVDADTLALVLRRYFRSLAFAEDWRDAEDARGLYGGLPVPAADMEGDREKGEE